MRAFLMASVAAFLLTSAPAGAQSQSQSPPPPAPAVLPAATAEPAFEGVTIGEPLAGLRDRLGDPLTVLDIGSNDESVWRYLSHNGAVFVDVLAKRNVAFSVTVVGRFPNSPYVAPSGVRFGITADELAAKLGKPTRTTTNQDDGSVDLWFLDGKELWIYEFHADRLDFVQLVSPHGVDSATTGAAPAVTPGDGSSFDRSVKVVQPLLMTPFWIDAYVVAHPCGNDGHWIRNAKNAQTTITRGSAEYTVVHAACSDASGERDFFFDTTSVGKTLEKPAQSGGANHVADSPGPTAIYIDAATLQSADPSPAPSAAPATAPRGGTSFDDAIVIQAASESAGTAAEYAYLAAHPCMAGARWILQKQALVQHAQQPYDVLSVACSDGSKPARDFYFDIRSFFGKY